MAFTAFSTGFQPGMTLTADRLNSGDLVGRVIFKATRDTNQGITSTTSANPDITNALSWETISIDDLTGWSSGSATRYTCQLAGWYKIDAKVSFNAWSASAGSVRAMGIYVNGTLQAAGHFRTAATPTQFVHSENGSLTLLLAVGDYVQVVPGQNSGDSPLNTATGGTRPSLEITFARHA